MKDDMQATIEWHATHIGLPPPRCPVLVSDSKLFVGMAEWRDDGSEWMDPYELRLPQHAFAYWALLPDVPK